MPFYQLRETLATDIANFLNVPEITRDTLVGEFNSPPKAELGHIALPCFKLAKTLKKSTHEISKDLCDHLNTLGYIATPTGPYANIKWDPKELYQKTITPILTEGDGYGSDTAGNDKRVVFEYCSPNIAKKLAFQHIRSTLIGNTLANVYDFLGYNTERINFIGDWGAQFARLLAAVQLWGDKSLLSLDNVSDAMDHLFELYVRFHKELEQTPELIDKANSWLKQLENHDKDATELWTLIRTISITSMSGTLKRMNIRFDHTEGESSYVEELRAILDQVKKKSKARLSEGAWIVDVPGVDTPALIQKSDGTTLYITRDIAAAIHRHERFKFDKLFYVVSQQQALHFRLLFGVLKTMGYEWSDSCEHLNFGTVLFGTAKMSTREGRVIFLEKVLDDAKAIALKECIKKNPDLENKEQVAEMVGKGGIIFGELNSTRTRDIEFDWDHVLALDGETGPYVQYSLVRCRSLLKKAGLSELQPENVTLPNADLAPEEEALVLVLSRFRAVLHQTAKENEPHHLTRYLIEVAKTFNRFYYQLPVLQATDPEVKAIRLNLVVAVQQTLKNGFSLLGVDCPEQM